MDNRTYPVQIDSYARHGKDARITCYTTVEVSSDDMKYFDENMGNQCFLLITNTHVGLEMPDIDVEKLKASMVENKIYEKDITPSERQRRKIWVLYTKQFNREPSKEEFEDYYMKWMDKIDSTLADKIASFNLN